MPARDSSPSRRLATIGLDLTPLIDVTFQLIVFFLLVGQITNVQFVEEIELARPDASVARPPGEGNRLILNAMPDPATGDIRNLRLGSLAFTPDPAGLAALAEELRAALRDQPELSVDLRADRRSPYGQIHPVLEAVRAAGVPRLNLVVQDEPRP